MNLTLAQIFGTGASQNSITITIQKSALLGLIPNANNRAEEILAAIIKTANQKFEGWLTDPDGNAILSPDDNFSVDYDNSAIYESLGIQQWKTQVIEQKQKIRHTFLIFSYSVYAD